MEILRKIDEKSLNSCVRLRRLKNKIYALDFQLGTPFFLKKGTIIWRRNENWYDVYELTRDLPSSSSVEEVKTSIEMISSFLNQI